MELNFIFFPAPAKEPNIDLIRNNLIMIDSKIQECPKTDIGLIFHNEGLSRYFEKQKRKEENIEEGEREIKKEYMDLNTHRFGTSPCLKQGLENWVESAEFKTKVYPIKKTQEILGKVGVVDSPSKKQSDESVGFEFSVNDGKEPSQVEYGFGSGQKTSSLAGRSIFSINFGKDSSSQTNVRLNQNLKNQKYYFLKGISNQKNLLPKNIGSDEKTSSPFHKKAQAFNSNIQMVAKTPIKPLKLDRLKPWTKLNSPLSNDCFSTLRTKLVTNQLQTIDGIGGRFEKIVQSTCRSRRSASRSNDTGMSPKVSKVSISKKLTLSGNKFFKTTDIQDKKPNKKIEVEELDVAEEKAQANIVSSFFAVRKKREEDPGKRLEVELSEQSDNELNISLRFQPSPIERIPKGATVFDEDVSTYGSASRMKLYQMSKKPTIASKKISCRLSSSKSISNQPPTSPSPLRYTSNQKPKLPISNTAPISVSEVIPCLFFPSTKKPMFQTPLDSRRREILMVYFHANAEDICDVYHLCHTYNQAFNVITNDPVQPARSRVSRLQRLQDQTDFGGFYSRRF